jgi:pilus assembly protein Flp/PilA
MLVTRQAPKGAIAELERGRGCRLPSTAKLEAKFIIRSSVMRKALEVVKKFANDEEGAALIEYTVLLGVLIVTVIATIGLVGKWVAGNWTALCTSLGAATSGTTC